MQDRQRVRREGFREQRVRGRGDREGVWIHDGHDVGPGRRDPAYADAHLNLGAALSLAGDPDGARAHYDRAIALDPRNERARYALALLLIAEGRAAEARKHLEAALALKPDFPAARAALESLDKK